MEYPINIIASKVHKVLERLKFPFANRKCESGLLNAWIKTCFIILSSIAFPAIVRPNHSSHHCFRNPFSLNWIQFFISWHGLGESLKKPQCRLLITAITHEEIN